MLQDNTDGHLAEEAQIPEVFNEIDANGDPESSWIRNIVNFKLYDSNMQPVSFSELGEGKPLATLVGEVVVPLSSELKQRIIESTCTVAQQLIPDTFTQVGNADVQISATTGSAPPVLAPWFDTELFYEQMYRSNGNCMPEVQRLPVIIKGIEDWAVEYSYALPSMYLVAQSGVWYRVAGPLFSGHIPLLGAKYPPNSTNPWGLYATPKLTASEDAVADCEAEPICTVHDPYLNPDTFGCSISYKSVFQEAMETFFVSAHVVFSVLDVIVNNPRACNLEIVGAEALARSAGAVTLDLMVKYSQFLIEQIRALEPPLGASGKPLNLESCTFVNQLKKESEKQLTRTHTDKSKKAKSVSAAPGTNNKSKAISGINGFLSIPAKAKTPQDIPIVVTPMPDAEYWRALAEENLGPAPFPYPVGNDCSVPFGLPDRQHVGMLLQIWSILKNFQEHFKLPSISPDLLASCLMLKDAYAPPPRPVLNSSDVNQYNAVDLLTAEFSSCDGYQFVAELHIRLISPLIQSRVSAHKTLLSSVNKFNFSVCPAEEVVDVAQDFEDSGFNLNSSPGDYYAGIGAIPGAGMLLLDADTYGTGDVELAQIESLLRMGGDSWVEAMRLFVADKYSVDSGSSLCLPEYAAPAVECSNILKWILTLPEAKHLIQESVPKKRGGNDSDEDEDAIVEPNDKINNPETLQQVLENLQKGLYLKVNNRVDSSKQTNDDVKISDDTKVGDLIDYFDTAMGMWCVSEVVAVSYSTEIGAMEICDGYANEETASASRLFKLRCTDWVNANSGNFDVILPCKSDLLAPQGAFSSKNSTKFSTPIIGEDTLLHDEKGSDLKVATETTIPGLFLGGMKRLHADVTKIFTTNICALSASNEHLAMSTKAVQALFNEVFTKRIVAPASLHQTTTSVVSSLSEFQMANAGDVIGHFANAAGSADFSATSEPVVIPTKSLPLTDGVGVVRQLTMDKWLQGRSADVNRGPSDMPPVFSNWTDVIDCLRCTEYVSLPFEMRLQCLNLLCLELISQSEIYDSIVNGSEVHSSAAVGTYRSIYNTKVRDRSGGASTKPIHVPDPDPRRKSAPLPTTTSRRSNRNSGGAEDLKPVDSAVQADVLLPVDIGPDQDHQQPQKTIYSRIYPIGEDRDGRLYWIFDEIGSIADHDGASSKTEVKETFSRLFCEELSPLDKLYGPSKLLNGNKLLAAPQRVAPSSWYSFDSIPVINELIWWLSDWGLMESRLKIRILEWRNSKLLRESAGCITRKKAESKNMKSTSGDHLTGMMGLSEAMEAENDNTIAMEDCVESIFDVVVQVNTETDSQTKTSESEKSEDILENDRTCMADQIDVKKDADTSAQDDGVAMLNGTGEVEERALATTSTSTFMALDESQSDVLDLNLSSPNQISGRARRSTRSEKYNGDFLTADDMNKALTIGAISKSQKENVKQKKRKSDSWLRDGSPFGKSPDDVLSPADKKRKIGGKAGDNGHSFDYNKIVSDITTDAHKEARVAEIEARLMEVANLRTFHLSNMQSTNQALCSCLKLHLGSQGQLGVAVKDIQGSIVVTGYYNDVDGVSPGRIAGIRLGDRILYCNDQYINDISCLQGALKKGFDIGNKSFFMVVLRHASPLNMKMIQRCTLDDKVLKSAFRNQSRCDLIEKPAFGVEEASIQTTGEVNPQTDHSNSEAPHLDSLASLEKTIYGLLVDYFLHGSNEKARSASYEGIFSNPILPRHHVYPAQCLGVLFQMMLGTAHPFVTSRRWRVVDAPLWSSSLNVQIAIIETLIDKASTLSASDEKVAVFSQNLGREVAKLKSLVKSCLVALIPALDELKTAYLPSLSAAPEKLVMWMAKLSSSCEKAMSWQAISTCISILYISICWEDIETATQGVERDKFMKQFDPKRKFGYIPRAGDTVLYFASGHEAALRDEAKRFGMPSMWTSRNYPNFASATNEEGTSILPFGGKQDVMCVCTVNRVVCFPSGLGTATGGYGRAGKNRKKSLLVGDRKASFPFAYVELVVKGNASNVETLGHLNKVLYDAADVSDVYNFKASVAKAVKKYQHMVTGACPLCDPNVAEKMGHQIKEWITTFEINSLPISIEALVPGAPKDFIPMGDLVASSCYGYHSTDDEDSRNRYVSSLLLALTKTLNILCANPLHGAFLLLVDADLFPDYYDLIKKPITLRIIETNILQLKYTHVTHFYADILLLRDNCIKYCSERYPDMIVTAESLTYTSICLCERFLSNFLHRKFEKSVSHGDDLMESVESVRAESQNFPPVGDTFNIGVRLLGNCSEYIIPISKYSACGAIQAKGRYPVGSCFSMSYQVANPDEDGGIGTENSVGIITGTKGPSSTRLVPWEWLKVSWISEAPDAEESGDLPLYVNPWEIDMVNYPMDLQKLNYSY